VRDGQKGRGNPPWIGYKLRPLLSVKGDFGASMHSVEGSERFKSDQLAAKHGSNSVAIADRSIFHFGAVVDAIDRPPDSDLSKLETA
jgi:hypothetical protein